MQVKGRRRVHCSYHKCLTVYFERVFARLDRSPLGPHGGYRHFESRADAFYRECDQVAVASLNNHALDLDRFEDVRVSRFVRDPRDLVVSGYFYHKRAAEPWCEIVAPTDEDWRVVNGVVPEALGPHRSFARYLAEVPLEEGLLAELRFRERHFASMRTWIDDDPRIALFRYEDVIGNETEVFDRIFQFYGPPFSAFGARQIGLHYVRKFRVGRRSHRHAHIRDPRPGQWRELFTPAVTKQFEREHGDLIERYGYPRT